eukprot:1136276-Pelagomonas_calceolata.AAC.1
MRYASEDPIALYATYQNVIIWIAPSTFSQASYCAHGGGNTCLPSSECQTQSNTPINMEHCMGTYEMNAYKLNAAVHCSTHVWSIYLIQ